MKWVRKIQQVLPLVLVTSALIICGCEGSEPREQVDDTVKEVSGAKNVERMQQMKKDIEVIEGQKADHAKQLEESAE